MARIGVLVRTAAHRATRACTLIAPASLGARSAAFPCSLPVLPCTQKAPPGRRRCSVHSACWRRPRPRRAWCGHPARPGPSAAVASSSAAQGGPRWVRQRRTSNVMGLDADHDRSQGGAASQLPARPHEQDQVARGLESPRPRGRDPACVQVAPAVAPAEVPAAPPVEEENILTEKIDVPNAAVGLIIGRVRGTLLSQPPASRLATAPRALTRERICSLGRRSRICKSSRALTSKCVLPPAPPTRICRPPLLCEGTAQQQRCDASQGLARD